MLVVWKSRWLVVVGSLLVMGSAVRHGNAKVVRENFAMHHVPEHLWSDTSVVRNEEAIENHLHRAHHNVTICFDPNASYALRMEPLSSPHQPLLLQLMGGNPSLENIYNRTILVPLNEVRAFVSPFLSFLWFWSDLRLVLESTRDVSSIKLIYYRTPGAFCWLGHRMTSFSTSSLPEVIRQGSKFMNSIVGVICDIDANGHGHGYPIECEASSDNVCVAAVSPFYRPCITISHEFTGLFSLTQDVTVMSTYYSVLSLELLQNFVFGTFLFVAAESLSRTRLLHYMLGALFGVSLSVLLVFYLVIKQGQRVVSSVPGSGLIKSSGLIATYFYPMAGAVVILPYLKTTLQWATGFAISFWAAESVMGIPHLGKGFFVVFAIIGMLAVWYNQWWASPKVHREMGDADDDEDIIFDEEDEIPLTPSQMTLARCFKLLGLVSLMSSTSSLDLSVGVFLALCSLPLFGRLYWYLYYYWWFVEAPGRHSRLISTKDYKSQSTSETDKALKELQAYLAKNPSALEKVKETSEIRIRRFAHGKDHLGNEPRASISPRTARFKLGRSWPCTVQ